MTEIQKQALTLMAEQNIGAIQVKGFGWVFPTHIRNDYGRFGEERAVGAAKGIVRQLAPTNTSEMTYRERYNATTEWEARHIAKDLMEMNGPDEFISERDDELITAAEQKTQPSKPYLSGAIDECYRLMGLLN